MEECEIIIPYGSDGNLGAAYNRAMEKVQGWVAFQDHDILQVNPNWYKMVLSAIEKVGRGAGFVTGVTNAIACPVQLCADAPAGNDIIAHMKYAKERQTKYGWDPVEVPIQTLPFPFSGFLIITHKGAWRASGGFEGGFLGVDNWYHQAVVRAGYKGYVIPGLYMYHTYRNKDRWKDL